MVSHDAALGDTDAPGAFPPLRHNRGYRRLWLGQAVSLLGDEVLDTAIMLWLGLTVGGQSWGPAAVGGVAVARVVPILLFSLIGGVYSDRWDRRRTMLAMDAVRGFLVLGLTILLLAGDGLPVATRLTGVYAVVALCAVAAQFFNPARYGLLATVVADAHRERMASIITGTSAVAAIAGPALAAGMLVAVGVQWSLLVTAAGFAVSYAAVAGLPAPAIPVSPKGKPPVWQELRAGLRFFAGNRVLRVMLVTAILVAGAVEAISTLDIFFVTRNLHAPVGVYGVLSGALGVGLVIGSALAAAFASRLRAARVYTYGYLLIGLLIVAYSRTTTPLVAIAVLCLVGIPTAAVDSMVGPLIMRATPSELMGRVSSVFQPVSNIASMLSIALTAWLAGSVLRDLDATVAGVHFGPIDTIFLGAGAIIAITGGWAAFALRGTRNT
jgi:MFS family permease